MSQANSKPPFPGIPATTDGSGGVVSVETRITQAACAYPITPTTNMGVEYAAASSAGMNNLWGEPIQFIEAESEHSSASSSEGYMLAGGRVSNFTSGQGLILMKEVLYVISGKRLGMVFNIGARAMTSQALNIHAGHDDVMGVADVGWGMLFARNAQEATDLNVICRKVAEETHTPFMNIQDGFLTTHTLESIVLPEDDLLRQMVGSPHEKIKAIFDTEKGTMSGTVQNQDAYMRGKIAQRTYYAKLKPSIVAAMNQYHQLTGRRYGLVEGYRMEDAEYAILAMGSMAETATAVVDHLRSGKGMKVGVVHLCSFRPFPGPELVEALKNVKAFAVLERLDIPSAQSNPLAAETKAAFADALTGEPGYPKIGRIPAIVQGSAGLGSRDIDAGDLIAVYNHLAAGKRDYFTLHIDHPTAIHSPEKPDIRPKDSYSLRGYSIGGFGSVTTNKVIATVGADLFGLKVQANSAYGSEKKGLPTNYFLTMAPEHIRSHCEMAQVEFVTLNDINALERDMPFTGLAQGGSIFVTWGSDNASDLWAHFPEHQRQAVRQANARVYYLDTKKIASDEANREDLIIRMQGIALLGVFLKVAPFREREGLSDETLFEGVHKALNKYFGSKSESVVTANLRVVKRGYQEVQEIPASVIATSPQRPH